MRRWIIGLLLAGFALGGGYAVAQIVPAFPFQLQNNTTADATQVMANFNQLLNSINTNAAKNGANSDITSLLGLTTPIAPSVGGTTTWTGITSGGTANAQTLTPVVPAVYSLSAGSRVGFIVGTSNTDATTLNVASSGAKNIYRSTQLGPKPVVGGELVAGQWVEVIYDGTQYQLVGRVDQVGEIRDYTGTTAPAGWVIGDGSCQLQAGTQYATLFLVTSTTWGSCSAGSFAIPDARGRAMIALDGGANRITNAGSACTSGLATACGTQNTTLIVANLPAYTPGGTITLGTFAGALTTNYVGTFNGVNQDFQSAASTGASFRASTVTFTGTLSFAGTAQGGTSTPFSQLQPMLFVNKIVKL